MEPKGLLLHSQVPATCPYPEPALSSPYTHIPLPEELTLTIILPTMVSFPHVSTPKPCIYLSSPPQALRALPITFFSVLSPKQYWYWSLSCSLCNFLPSPVTSSLLDPYSQHPILKHPWPTFLPQCEWPGFTPIQNDRQNYSSLYLHL